ncbi:5'-methylthioadenosine/adenosylhomocysteine nucleosidase [Bordetella genomosp. 1]|uniref:adenosylhomocysteine nucleosidase n=1 Tax=Bordetella genomosp. 1 TaxID=1395607 RepID=A0ABX4F4C1_9BORD|nr:5'-methylthioadenosine/adenosylhomocysteine nucleosidase [Bordetella genomosp. 1]OZI68176.1 5'-methylthioadenosine/S-adenosylhomocysteine nucleosidase [Bordetella genomosp. 1]
MLGILAALPEEITELLAEMGPTAEVHRIGMRDYHVGMLAGQPCVLVLTRIGKVAAAATTAMLLHAFGVRAVVFTGVAGGIHPRVQVGDVVIGDALLQHDLDARPLFPRYEVPLLARSHFATEAALTALLGQCAADFLAGYAHGRAAQPAVHHGPIATGDCFVGDAVTLARLREELPQALCVEMEGAAVAQVCHEFGVPCAVLRTISDRADNAAPVDFKRFLTEVASVYSAGILRRFLRALPAPGG